MKFEVTEHEKHFACLISGINSFVTNVLEEYEQKLRILATEIKKLQDEKVKIEKELAVFKIDEAIKVAN